MLVLTRRPDHSTSPEYCVECGRATIDWPLWSTTARLVVTDPAALGEAKDLADGVLDEIAAACNRFDPAAEIHRVEAAQGAPVVVSAVLADLLTVAVKAASFTNGDVDPTLGSALRGRVRPGPRGDSVVGRLRARRTSSSWLGRHSPGW